MKLINILIFKIYLKNIMSKKSKMKLRKIVLIKLVKIWEIFSKLNTLKVLNNLLRKQEVTIRRIISQKRFAFN